MRLDYGVTLQVISIVIAKYFHVSDVTKNSEILLSEIG